MCCIRMDGELNADGKARGKTGLQPFSLYGDFLTQQNTFKVLAEQCHIIEKKQ